MTGAKPTYQELLARVAELEHERRQFASFPERNPNPVVEVGLEGRIRYLNPAAEKLLPGIQQNGLGHPWLADWATCAKSLQESHDGEHTRVIALGERLYQQTMRLLPEVGLVHIYGMDVTERRQAERLLKASNTRYRRLFEAAKDGILILDADTGKVVDVNPFLSELTGWSHEDFLGKHLWDIGSFQDVVASKAAFAELQAKGYVRYDDLPLETRDGRRIAVEFVSNVYRADDRTVIQCNIRDVTERKSAEKALRDSEEKHRLLVENSHDIVYLLDLEGSFTFVSPAWTTLVGHPPAEVVGRPFRQFVHPDDIERCLAFMHSVYEAGQRQEGVEYRVRHIDGSWRWHMTSAVPVRNPAGEIVGGEGIARDITERRRAEDALKASEAFFSSVFSQSAYAQWISDEHGTLMSLNRACRELLHITDEEVVGKYNVLHDDIVERQGFMPLVRSVFDQGERVTFTLEYDTADLRHLDLQQRASVVLEVTISPVKDAEGRVTNAVIQHVDITGRKRAEEVTRRAEESARQATSLLRRTFDAIPDLLTVHDRDLRVVLSNWHGRDHVKQEERESKPHCYSCYMRREQPCEPCPTLEVFRTGEPVRMEVTNLFSGRLLEVSAYPVADVSGAVGLVAEHVRDITARKQAEEALRESEEKFRELFDAAGDLIAVVDLRTNFIALNEKFEDESEWSKAEMLNQSVLTSGIVTPESSLKIAEYVAEIVAGRSVPIFEVTGVTKSGKKIPYELRAVPLRRNGEIVAIQAILRNLTERKAAEAERAALEAQLQQAQKMESVGRLAGGVAHDFNNMLSIILSNVHFSLEQVDPSQPLHADLEEVRKAARHAADLTRQLLAFARKQVVSPRVLDPNETVGGMLKMLQRLIGEDIDLTWQPGSEVWPIKVDPSQIDQILANLCLNARDAIANVGRISIETANRSFDEDYCTAHAGFVPGDYVRLTVSDDGSGIDKETMANIFEPFFTTKEMGKGTGLGLATVYGIVKQNSGFINTYSEPGQGTTFTIYLPRYVPKTAVARSMAPVMPVVGGHETILLVEDDPAILKATKRMLDGQGYSVLTASTPGEGIRLAKEHAGEIHLLITDVVMPEMNGRDLAKNLLGLYPEIKRLFMSGYTANVIAHHGVLDEGVSFLQKPFSPEELDAKVREALQSGEAKGRDG